ncbi:unnamed protein product, partial [Urochloa humidicola]
GSEAGSEDTARRSSAVERDGPKRWRSASAGNAGRRRAAEEDGGFGTAGYAHGAEESSTPEIVILCSGSGGAASSLSTSVGATPDLPPVRSWCRAGFPPPPPPSIPKARGELVQRSLATPLLHTVGVDEVLASARSKSSSGLAEEGRLVELMLANLIPKRLVVMICSHA